MNTSTATMTSSTSANDPSALWQRLWRSSGIGFLVFIAIAYVLYGNQPHVGATADALVTFYASARARILVAVVLSGMALLNLMWFAAAIRATLSSVGQGGWGAAATAASATLGSLLFLLLALSAGIAYSIGESGEHALLTGLNDFGWATFVLSSFPRAMLVMSGTFGLWRAGLISNALFACGLAAVVLVLLGGTTWFADGFWAPDGAYSRFISPIVSVVWLVVFSRLLLDRSPATRAGW